MAKSRKILDTDEKDAFFTILGQYTIELRDLNEKKGFFCKKNR